MKTAMQQLMDLMSEQPFTFGNAINLVILNELLEKEKEQIMMAFNDGKVNAVLKKINSTEYYNQTYNQNK